MASLEPMDAEAEVAALETTDLPEDPAARVATAL